MPIKIQKDLPAKAILESENIFVMDEDRAAAGGLFIPDAGNARFEKYIADASE